MANAHLRHDRVHQHLGHWRFDQYHHWYGGNVLTAIDQITGSASGSSTVSSGALVLATGTASNLSITGTGNALTALGLGTGVTQALGGGTTALGGLTLTIAATNPSLTATTITFGTTGNDVSTLNQLNTALATNDLQASINSTGAISITTTNNAASSTVGAISGTAVTTVLRSPAWAPVVRLRLPIRTRRPPAPTWSRSTTTC